MDHNATEITPHNRPRSQDLWGSGVQNTCLSGMETEAGQVTMVGFMAGGGGGAQVRDMKHAHREDMAMVEMIEMCPMGYK